ncbi:DUF2690 domain-containing protein [Catenulispora sp. NF23]|uniref:DUF2690 domain-containing protein n=1 Tax=Catenulispora pinistramenti TaxID=2705254 RepID=UPI001BA4D55A|nr:DUF2690 domain-containing protein [Catenulispora pinistramenti]MBS2539124.1 DUF2690 domain-containing protein [Catenulispora pinistramenti]
MWGKLPEDLGEEQRALVEALRGAKDESGLSLQQLGRQTHYSSSSWERWLNGKRPVPVQAVAKLVQTGIGSDGLVELARRARQPSSAGPSETADTETQDGDGADPDPAAADDTRPLNPGPLADRRPARRRALRLASRTSVTAAGLSMVLMALLVPVLGGDSPAVSVGLVKTGPALNAEVAPRCRGQLCAGADPQIANCGYDARTVTTRTLLGDTGPLLNVQLRYSPACQAAWAKVADGRPGDTVSVQTAAGQQQSSMIHYGIDGYTPMIDVTASASVTACATDAGARVCTVAQTLPPTGPLPAQGATTAIQGSSPAYIRAGDVGTGVRCIQQALNYWDHAGLPVDGVNGDTTIGAIERFQREQNLSVDGVVGPDTAGPIYTIDNTYLHLGGTCRDALPTPAAPKQPTGSPTAPASP